MTIFVKNKHTLQIDEFKFRCCIGKNGSTNKKKDADDEVRTRAPVGYSVTVMYHCYSQCSYVGYLNAEIEIEVWTVGL